MKLPIQKFLPVRGRSEPGNSRRFVLTGLPRSGTTYLMSLLNGHPDIYCMGEQYNPYAVIAERHDDSHLSVLNRDKDPVGFMEAFFASRNAQRVALAGFKFMIGHNIEVLRKLEADPDITLIYVWRDNRLAQISSLIKALQSKNWAQGRPNNHLEKKIQSTPRQISQRWHEFATFDHLFSMWLETRPNPKITLEYRELFQPGFAENICEFLNLEHHPKMKSRLVKQGHNTILDRFEEPKHIRYYFTQIGKAHWLDEEL